MNVYPWPRDELLRTSYMNNVAIALNLALGKEEQFGVRILLELPSSLEHIPNILKDLFIKGQEFFIL